ncbi:uncharacterized protein FA14DRAFT_180598 [Meira miltonrushii]|uniref:DNA 5'-3' helicase n=1 Tax=Meira miltonrushii TaxID=1280837 RepID=A0A316VDA4_9BASI|nr:uncharacterized protein FA14DRAFT_180598 [Meira miltonrushii]PWN33961.1 hypothetical protein FA14DRAFT_180598 [Meira miltonrushii]
MLSQAGRSDALQRIQASLGKKYSEHGNVRQDYLRRIADKFHLPDRRIAYIAQAELMIDIFETIEKGKIGVFEVPTSEEGMLSLICSPCLWFEEHLRIKPELNTSKDRAGLREIQVAVQQGARREQISEAIIDGAYGPRVNRFNPPPRFNPRPGVKPLVNAKEKARLVDEVGSNTEILPKLKLIYVCHSPDRLNHFIENFNKTVYARKKFTIHEVKEDFRLPLDDDEQVQVIVMYYENLLDAELLEFFKISFSGAIMILDEAYSLPEFLASEKSVVLIKKRLEYAIGKLQRYLLTPSHGSKTVDLESSKLLRVLQDIDDHCSKIIEIVFESDSIRSKEFLNSIGGSIEQEVLRELESWYYHIISESVRDFETPDQGQVSKDSIETILPLIRTFLKNLIHPAYEGMIHIPDPTYRSEAAKNHSNEQGEKQWSFEYQLLNLGAVLEGIIEEARSVIFCGDVLAPMTDLKLQLFPYMKCTKFKVKSYPPFVSDKNFMIGSVKNYSHNIPLKYIYKTREEEQNMRQLLKMIIEHCKVTPDGVVVFVTAHDYLNSLRSFWYSDKAEDLFTQLEDTKNVFFDFTDELVSASELQKYKEAIRLPSRSNTKKGVIMFAVINSRLSEEFDFRNRLARTVVFVGLPLAYVGVEMKEKTKYIDKNWGSSNANAFFKIEERYQPRPKPGEAYYINLSTKSIQRIISRVNADPNDYTAVLLLDERAL